MILSSVEEGKSEKKIGSMGSKSDFNKIINIKVN